MFTKLPELSTSLTNLIILIVALFSFIKTKEVRWKVFFFILVVSAFLGAIIHGFVMDNVTKLYLWLVLYMFFAVIINVLLFNSLKLLDRFKRTDFSWLNAVLSFLLYFCVLILEYKGIDFLKYYIIYAFFVLFIITFVFIKIFKKNPYFLIGIIFQILGGLILISKFKTSILDYNGYYHIFMSLTTYYFYRGVNFKK